jgi:hypothetical protein
MSENRPDDPGSRWLPDGAGIRRGDQVGGDDQASESYSIRFNRADRSGAIITRTAYPVTAAKSCEGQFLIRVETEWLVCSNPMDPGGTEVWSDRRTEDETGSYETAAEAERAAQDVASELLRDVASLTWDGLPQWERGDS